MTGEAVDPDESKHGADRDRDDADEDAGAAHTLEEFERRKAPDEFGEIAIAEETVFDEEDEAEDKRQREGGVGEDAERDVEGEDGAVGWRWKSSRPR